MVPAPRFGRNMGSTMDEQDNVVRIAFGAEPQPKQKAAHFQLDLPVTIRADELLDLDLGQGATVRDALVALAVGTGKGVPGPDDLRAAADNVLIGLRKLGGAL